MTVTVTARRATLKTRVLLDVALLVAYVAISAPQSTGVAFHEWFIVAFVPIFIAHIVLDWTWVRSVFRRSGKQRSGDVRFNRAFDIVLFVAMIVAIYSGFLVSEVMLPSLGFHPESSTFWFTVHDSVSNLLILLIGIHLAMHWPWITKQAKRFTRQESTT